MNKMTQAKSIIFGLIMMFFSMPLFAQESNEIETIIKEIQSLYQNLEVDDYQNILPYKVKDKTGFVNAKNKKRILKPTANLKEVTLAKPNIKGFYKEDYEYSINTKTQQVNVIKINRDYGLLTMEGIDQPKIDVLDSRDGYKGFKVDDNGKLLAYSDLYYAQGQHEFNVSPFKFKGKDYAIATKKTGDDEYFGGIIDTEGNALPQFNFNVKCILKIKEETDDIWFSIGLCRGLKGSLVSFNGKVKFENELLGWLNSSGNIFKYNHNHDDKWTTHGIFDVDKLEWIIKPQSKLKIRDLDYTSYEQLDRDNIADGSKASIYFLVEDGNKSYYMDLSLNKYLP
ncbi:hypothetical protein L1275_002105 [Flavobacterium sp. HSC-61S13]|nr:hypothetical protein [Flavobacterium sp. HSC-61S13]